MLTKEQFEQTYGDYVDELNDCMADTVQLIEKFIEAGMPEDFYYVKEQE